MCFMSGRDLVQAGGTSDVPHIRRPKVHPHVPHDLPELLRAARAARPADRAVQHTGPVAGVRPGRQRRRRRQDAEELPAGGLEAVPQGVLPARSVSVT